MSFSNERLASMHDAIWGVLATWLPWRCASLLWHWLLHLLDTWEPCICECYSTSELV